MLLTTAACLSRALARRSAAVRHHVWAFAIAAALLLPVFSSLAPRWTIAVLPAAAQSDAVALVPPANAVTPAQMTNTNITVDAGAPLVSSSNLVPPHQEAAPASPFSILTSI